MRKQHWARRDPIKNYFPLPNEIFSLGLSSTAIVIYGYLLYREDRKTYECLASYRMIGEAIGKSVTTVRKYVAELEEQGLITTERTSIMTKEGRKWNGCLRYHILPIQMSIDQFNKRQLRRPEVSAVRQKAQAKLSRLREAQEPPLAVGQPTTPPAAERSVSRPCGPVCEADGFGDLPNSQMNRGVEKSAG